MFDLNAFATRPSKPNSVSVRKPQDKTSKMLFSLRRLLFFFFVTNLATASVLDTRQTSSVLVGDATTIASDACKCAQLLNQWNGAASTFPPIQQCIQQLEADIKKAISDANNSQVLTSAQCKELVAYITQKLEPCLKSLITALINRKNDIIAAGLYTTVKQDLKDLKNLFTLLIQAIQPKLPKDCLDAWNAVVKQIQADLDQGLAAYP